MLFEQQTFQKGERIILDGNEYKACDFRDCTVVYNGGELSIGQGCSFGNCKWEFGDAAIRTINLMRMIYHMHGSGSEFIEGIIDNHIRRK
jgi:hypothetical protein